MRQFSVLLNSFIIRIRFFATLNIFDGNFLFSCAKPERPQELISKNRLYSFFSYFLGRHAYPRLIRFFGDVLNNYAWLRPGRFLGNNSIHQDCSFTLLRMAPSGEADLERARTAAEGL